MSQGGTVNEAEEVKKNKKAKRKEEEKECQEKVDELRRE